MPVCKVYCSLENFSLMASSVKFEPLDTWVSLSRLEA